MLDDPPGTNCTDQKCRVLDEQRRSRAGGGEPASRRKPVGHRSARLDALQSACRPRCRPRASSSPGWRNMGSNRTAGPVDAGAHRSRLGDARWKPRCARSLNALEPWAGMDTVRAFATDAPPAKLAFYATARRRPTASARTRRCRSLARAACSLGDAGLKALLSRLAGRRVHRHQHSTKRWRSAAKLTHWRSDHDARGPCRFSALRRGLLCARQTNSAGMLARAQEIENLGAPAKVRRR